jgi:hypothetical protein
MISIRSIAALLALTLLLTHPQIGTAQGGDVRTQPVTTTADVLAATVDKVLDDPKAFYGRHIAVTGDVDKILGPHAFVLEDNDDGSDEDLLVVSITPYQQIVSRVEENHVVTVTGFLSRLTDTDFEWDRKVLNLDGDVLDHYEGKPVLVIGLEHTHTSQK